jgi:polysaccharide deacetylase family protein (PEP-CTERM system associated)
MEPRVSLSEWRVSSNTEKILDLLAEHKVRATFFVLGSVAESMPELVPRIASHGHEIASHGYSHRPVTELGPTGFREELIRTGEILERQSGEKSVGFRAPQWSLSDAMPWAFEILHEEGYQYDSLPFVGNRAGSRVPYRVDVKNGQIWEIPPMVSPFFPCNLPTGGGWGLRLFPLGLISRTIGSLNGKGSPAVLFLHPREVDPEGPRLELHPLKRFVVYGSRTDLSGRVVDLIRRYRFGTLKEMVEEWKSA